MNIWQHVKGDDYTQPLEGRLWRLVESQEQIATLSYVDTLEEQALLEQMLEQVKPPYPVESDRFHYLLKTPFRYPPLEWGSRFGTKSEPSLMYGGLSVSATLAESAYYRFVFLRSMGVIEDSRSITTQHTLFSVNYKTNVGVQLQCYPFVQYASRLTHPKNYTVTQQLGTKMRDSGVQVFEYQSARDVEKNICVGIFDIAALATSQPEEMQPWLCQTNTTMVTFKDNNQQTLYQFPLDDFLLDGIFPLPA